MTSAYIIANVEVTNPEQYEEYKKLSSLAMKAHGAEVCIRGGKVEVLEGDWAPSRSSIASRLPVDAPLGTAARPMVPLSSSMSHSTVGLPRLSRISRPTISTMALIQGVFRVVLSGGRRGAGFAGPPAAPP